MIKETITYEDYNGIQRTEDYYFNLNDAELAEMELTTEGGMAEMLERIVAAKDTATIIKTFKDIILKAYGQKSLDGKRFIKEDENGYRLANDFKQTEAYSQLFMKLATDSDAASRFVNGIMPKKKSDKPALPSA